VLPVVEHQDIGPRKRREELAIAAVHILGEWLHHLLSAHDAWTGIDRPDLAEELEREFGSLPARPLRQTSPPVEALSAVSAVATGRSCLR
jgi:hypothetical protein